MDKSNEDPNPFGFLERLQEGQQWLDKLGEELVYLINDLMTYKDSLSEVTVVAIQYTIEKTEEAMERVELEMKMFEE